MPQTYRVAKYSLSYVREGSYSVPRDAISRRDDVVGIARHIYGAIPVEYVAVVALDNANRVVGISAVEGAVNQCAIYPQNVFRFLLTTGVASFVLVHNHPGGNLTPSGADWTIAERLRNLGKDLELPLLDHIIVTEESAVSLRDLPRWK